MIDLSHLTEPQLYDYLKSVWKRARTRFGNTENDEFAFQEENERVQLIGVRGYSMGGGSTTPRGVNVDKSGVYDDTIFIVYRDSNGRKKAAAYQASLQYGPNGNRDLMLGQHRYCFGVHKKQQPYINLSDYDVYPSGRGYRALIPFDYQLSKSQPVFSDTNKDMVAGQNEETGTSNTHNIHATSRNDPKITLPNAQGGQGSVNDPGSDGCQVISDWAQYKKLIYVIERDHSIKGTRHPVPNNAENQKIWGHGNELTPQPNIDGTRALIYTLVEAAFLEDYQLPTGATDERAISTVENATALANIARAYSTCENSTNGGYFPIGGNNCWHGGVHVAPGSDNHVYAPLAGEIVAFRLGSGEKGRALLDAVDDKGTATKKNCGDVNFILMRHVLPYSVLRAVQGRSYLNSTKEAQQNNLGANATQRPAQGEDFVFFSLYMHLSSSLFLTEEEIVSYKFSYPWLVDRYELTTNTSCKRTLGSLSQKRHEKNVLSNNQALKKGDQYQILEQTYLRQENVIWMQIKILRCETEAQLVGQVAYLPLSAKQNSKLIWGNTQLLQLINDGDIILTENHFGKPLPVFAGDKLWRSGEGEGPDGAIRPMLHWSIFSEKNLFEGCKEWKPVLDQTGDNIIEDTKILGMVPQKPERKGKPLSMDEVHDFYAATDKDLQKQIKELRKYAVKFQTEWATKLDTVLPKMEQIFGKDGRKLDKDQAKKKAEHFLWWKKVSGAVKLPTDGEVWHYNPISVLSALAGIEQNTALEHSQQFILKNQQSQPIPGARYRVVKTVSREVMAEGISDEAGKTERVYTEQKEKLELEYL